MNKYVDRYGKWALITGASSGIGEEFARRLAQDGINLIMVARRRKLLTDLSNELKQNFQIKTLVVVIDLSKADFMPKLIEKVGDREVGMLINNAGFGSIGQFNKIDSQHETDMINLNCVAPTILTHHFIEPMIERRKGAVIFLGSLVGYYPMPYMASYSASKVFNDFLGKALWYELKKYNIDVLSLNPGSTVTGFNRINKKNGGIFVRTAEDVVTTAFKALGKKQAVIDGTANKIIVILSKLIPDKVLIKILGNYAGKIYERK